MSRTTRICCGAPLQGTRFELTVVLADWCGLDWPTLKRLAVRLR